MGLKSRTFCCPDCDGQFTVLLDDRDSPPNFCQVCGNDMTAEPSVVPNFSRIGKAQNQTLDKTYRAMEAASIGRAEQAASMLGTSVAEQSNIKITNMKDNLREGDTSYIAPSPTPVAQMRGGAAPIPFTQAAGYASSPTSAGTSMLNKLRPNHHALASQMQRNGEQGRYSGK